MKKDNAIVCNMIQHEHFEKISLRKLKMCMPASPGRRQRRLRLSILSELREFQQERVVSRDLGLRLSRDDPRKPPRTLRRGSERGDLYEAAPELDDRLRGDQPVPRHGAVDLAPATFC